MRKGLWVIALGTLLAMGASAAPKAAKFTCTLTNKTVETCCCVQQENGKLYCTLAKQTVDACCCKEVAGR